MAALTRRVLDAPAASVTLVDPDRQVFPGAAGLNEVMTAERETPLPFSFCQHVVTWAEPLIVTDARVHPLLSENPAIVANQVVAYAGMPLRDLRGVVIGSLCVFDPAPRAWTDVQVETLRQLAVVCSAQLQLVESKQRSAVLAERERAASALNESVAHELLGLSMVLGSARSQTAGPVARLMDSAIGSVDTALTNLRSSVLGPRSGAVG